MQIKNLLASVLTCLAVGLFALNVVINYPQVANAQEGWDPDCLGCRSYCYIQFEDLQCYEDIFYGGCVGPYDTCFPMCHCDRQQANFAFECPCVQ